MILKMRAQIPKNHTTLPSPVQNTGVELEARPQLLQSLFDLAEASDSLIASSVGAFRQGSEEFSIPRFVFMGPKGGGNTVRLGFFSALHGDEPEGTEALVEFFRELEQTPGVARGFHLYAYPVCNPGSFAARTRHNASGCDLAGEFWCKSKQPEAYYLEREMGVHNFQGVVSIHTSKSSVKFLAACRSAILDEALAQPAIRATSGFIPGVVWDSGGNGEGIPSGFLTATDELRPAPFEINLGIPRLLPGPARIDGTVAALKSLLNSYRAFMALGQNL